MNKKTRIEMILILFLLTGFFLFVTPSVAQDYPKGPIQLVIPFGPGGSDLLWRILGDHLSRNLKVPVVFVNKPGGGGIVGMSTVVNSKPDGYTLCAGNSDTLNITPLFTKDLPFDTINDLTYIAKLAMFPQGILVRGESPFKTIDDIIAFAKANPKKLKVGTPGVGTSAYMAVNMFNHDAKVEITPVAFGGGAEVVPQILGGHVDFAFMSTMAVKSHLQTGKIRLLAFFANKRNPIYPDIPTSVEKGLKRTIIEVGMGLVGPKGLSPDVVKKWEDAIQLALKEPSVISAVEKLDYVIDFKRGENYKKEIIDEFAAFKQIMPELGGKK